MAPPEWATRRIAIPLGAHKMNQRPLTAGATASPTLVPICLMLAAFSWPASAQQDPANACGALVGTYVTTVTDIEGVFASRALATFTGDGTMLITDSGQSGLPGIYQPFTSSHGAWTCLGAEDGAIRAAASGLSFLVPGEGLSTSFGRADYRLTLDPNTGNLSGIVELSFTSDGDLESADPIEAPGPVFETFEIEGRRLVARSEPAES